MPALRHELASGATPGWAKSTANRSRLPSTPWAVTSACEHRPEPEHHGFAPPSATPSPS